MSVQVNGGSVAEGVMPAKRELVTALRAADERLREAEIERLAVVALMCEAWSVVEGSAFDSRAEDLPPEVLFGEQLVAMGGDGTPGVAEFLTLEVGPALGLSPDSARQLIADVLDLRHRLPILWEHALAGECRVWLARRVAMVTHALPLEAARRLDSRLSPTVPGMSPAAVLRSCQRLRIEVDPDVEARRAEALAQREVRFWSEENAPGLARMEASLDAVDAAHLDATLDRVAEVLAAGGHEGSHGERRAVGLGLLAHPKKAHLVIDQGLPLEDVATADARVAAESGAVCAHGAELVVRVSSGDLARGAGGDLEGFGPVTRRQLAELLADCARVTVRPVVDLHESHPVSVYAPPASIAWVVRERDQREMFPFSTRSARSRGIDLDHTIPASEGGVTCPTNLGPLSRRVHRARTHGGFHVDQPEPGLFRWRTPTGQVWWTDAHGTYPRRPDRSRRGVNEPQRSTARLLATALAIRAADPPDRESPPGITPPPPPPF